MTPFRLSPARSRTSFRGALVSPVRGALAALCVLATVVVHAADMPSEPPPGPPPDGAGPGGGGGGGPGGPPPSSRRAYTLSGAYTLADGSTKTETDRTFTSDKDDVSAVYVTGGSHLTLERPTLSTSGNSTSEENSSFHGLNAGLLATRASTVLVQGGTLRTTGMGANVVIATDAHTTVTIEGAALTATGHAAHGVMATAGGSLVLKDVSITTSGPRSAAIATDRGGGTVRASGGRGLTTGTTSPAFYSTGELDITGGTYAAKASEAAVIEGANSISLTDVAISCSAQWGVMIYQSFSGDAQGRRGVFTMQGGSLEVAKGPAFYVNNTTGVIHLSGGARIAAASGVLVDASAGRWGRSASNGGHVEFTAAGETLVGDLTCDKISSLAAKLTDGTVLTGRVAGVALALDATSQWHLTADSTITSLVLAPGSIAGGRVTNIHGHGHDVHYDASLAANRALGGRTYELADGGHLSPST